MTPEQEELLTKTAEMLQSLFATNTIPREVQAAFLESLGCLSAYDTGTPTTATTTSSFPVTIPANPTSTIKVLYKGVVRELLCK